MNPSALSSLPIESPTAIFPPSQAVLKAQHFFSYNEFQAAQSSPVQIDITSVSPGMPTPTMSGSAQNTANSLLETVNGLDYDSFNGDVIARRQALGSAQALVRRLQAPMDYMWELTYEMPALYTALKTAMDQNVYDTLGGVGGGPKTVQQLAGRADPALMTRILRHLAAMGVLTNPGPGLYGPTRHSSALRNAPIYAAVNYDKEVSGPAFLSLPFFLAETGFKNPDSAINGNWQYLTGDNETHWKWLAAHPQEQATFNNVMSGYTSQRGSWLDVYPAENLLASSNQNSTLIVDVGKSQFLQYKILVVPELAVIMDTFSFGGWERKCYANDFSRRGLRPRS